MDKAHMQVHKDIFCSLSSSIFSFSFLFIFGRKHFCRSREKIFGPTIYFPFSSPNQTHFKKVFILIFSQKIFIYPILPSNKHTNRGQNQKPKTRQNNNPPQKTKNHPQSPPTYSSKKKKKNLHQIMSN